MESTLDTSPRVLDSTNVSVNVSITLPSRAEILIMRNGASYQIYIQETEI